MPADFPPWPRFYAFFTRWRDSGLVGELHDRLRQAVRRVEGREPDPSAAVVDSQSVKADATVAHTSRGFDAGKKINGRKRHLLTDTLGLLLSVLVTPASTTDRDAARTLLPAATGRFRRLARVWADGGVVNLPGFVSTSQPRSTSLFNRALAPSTRETEALSQPSTTAVRRAPNPSTPASTAAAITAW